MSVLRFLFLTKTSIFDIFLSDSRVSSSHVRVFERAYCCIDMFCLPAPALFHAGPSACLSACTALHSTQGLKDLASEAKPFATDEDGVASSGMNPLASVFDLGKEPMDYWEDRVI